MKIVSHLAISLAQEFKSLNIKLDFTKQHSTWGFFSLVINKNTTYGGVDETFFEHCMTVHMNSDKTQMEVMEVVDIVRPVKGISS